MCRIDKNTTKFEGIYYNFVPKANNFIMISKTHIITKAINA